MKKIAVSIFSGTAVIALGVFAAPAQALLCPQLVKDCQALIAKVEKKGGNASKVGDAKRHCAEAQRDRQSTRLNSSHSSVSRMPSSA